MFEFDQATKDGGRAIRPELPYAPVTNISEMSFLIWGEHCIECAAPACFQTCDLYEARPDGRCRRFKAGAQRNEHFPSFRGHGVEIEFKKWAKVEARGNTRMMPARRARAMEWLARRISPVLG